MLQSLEVRESRRELNELSLAEFQTQVRKLGNVDIDSAGAAGVGNWETDFAELDNEDRSALVVESGFDR